MVVRTSSLFVLYSFVPGEVVGSSMERSGGSIQLLTLLHFPLESPSICSSLFIDNVVLWFVVMFPRDILLSRESSASSPWARGLLAQTERALTPWHHCLWSRSRNSASRIRADIVSKFKSDSSYRMSRKNSGVVDTNILPFSKIETILLSIF